MSEGSGSRGTVLRRVGAAAGVVGVATLVASCGWGTPPGNPPQGNYTTLANPAHVSGMPGNMIEFCEHPGGELYYVLDSAVSSMHSSAVAGIGRGTCPVDAPAGAWGTPDIQQMSQPASLSGVPGQTTVGCDMRNGTLLLGGSSSIAWSAEPALAAIRNGCVISDVGGVRTAALRPSAVGALTGAAQFRQTSQPSSLNGAPGTVTTTCLSPTDATIYSGDSWGSLGGDDALSLSALPGGCAGTPSGQRTYERLPGGDQHILGTPAIVREYRDKTNGALVISAQSNYDGGKFEAVASVPAAAARSDAAPNFEYLTSPTQIDNVPGGTETVCDTTHNLELLVSWSKDTIGKAAGQSLALVATPGCPAPTQAPGQSLGN